MFAAFQKASWNWIPIQSLGHSESDAESSNDLQPGAIDNTLQKIDKESSNLLLSSDEEERLSPRGILQFRKPSEGDLSQRSRDSDDLNPYLSVHETKTKTTAWPDTSGEEEPKKSANTYSQLGHLRIDAAIGQCASKAGKDCGDARAKASMANDKTGELKDAINHEPNYLNAATQTPTPRDDFSSTKIALQRRLTDALSALDLTRIQANALRDRLRTYTSSMKQQATDLRASSKSLSHALDKAKEYRTNWKKEEKLKEAANTRADELDSKTKSLEKTVSRHVADLNLFSREVDVLNQLLGVQKPPESMREKVAVASKEVKALLNLVEKVQAEAVLVSAVNTVELKESLRRFEDEKTSWIALTNKNEEVFSRKLKVLEMENEGLTARINTLQEASKEFKELWQRACTEISGKEEVLKKNIVTIQDLETALNQTREELKASARSLQSERKRKEELRIACHNEAIKLTEEKTQIEACLEALRMDLEEKSLSLRDQSVHCNLDVKFGICSSDSDSASELKTLRSSVSASKAQSRENDDDRKALQRRVAQLKHTLSDMKDESYEREQGYLRLRGDFRQLSWNSHQQQVIIQRVRAENRSLKISISKLRRGIQEDFSECERTSDSRDPDSQACAFADVLGDFGQRQSFPGGSGSDDDERNRLGNIPESSNESSKSRHEMNCAGSKENLQSSSEEVSTKVDYVTTSPAEKILEAIQTAGNGEQHVTQQTPSDCSSLSPRNSCSRSTLRRRKVRKAKKGQKSWLPVWRQENPENQYFVIPKRPSAHLESESSSRSEDVFVSSCDRDYVSERASADSQNLLELSTVSDQPSRLVAIPMDEGEFERLIGSLDNNNLTPIAYRDSKRRPSSDLVEAPPDDDGYASSAPDASEVNKCAYTGGLLHSTRLLSSSTCSSADTGRAMEKSQNERCFLTYEGVTFDAMTFDLTQMRKIAWEAGFAESENGMNGFIDFLAKKACELEDDPRWQGKHSLGKSCDWVSLKGLLS